MNQTKTNTAEEMSHAIRLWRESGLNQKAWCKQVGIRLGKFVYWKRKLEGTGKFRHKIKAKQEAVARSFIPVEVGQPSKEELSSAVSPSHTIEIIYPNGVKVNCPINLPLNVLQSLLNPS